MKKFILTCGAEVLLDDDDYERIPKTGWYLQKKREGKADRKTVYAEHEKYGKMHRYILGITDPAVIIDHIDKNGLNNQKSNLRIVSNSINKRNQNPTSNNKFNFNGISYSKGSNGRSDRIICHWSDSNIRQEKAKRFITHKKSFTLSKYNYDINHALRDAILFRIEKMRENNYEIDERSTTIERVLLENESPNMEEILGIKFSEVIPVE